LDGQATGPLPRPCGKKKREKKTKGEETIKPEGDGVVTVAGAKRNETEIDREVGNSRIKRVQPWERI